MVLLGMMTVVARRNLAPHPMHSGLLHGEPARRKPGETVIDDDKEDVSKRKALEAKV